MTSFDSEFAENRSGMRPNRVVLQTDVRCDLGVGIVLTQPRGDVEFTRGEMNLGGSTRSSLGPC